MFENKTFYYQTRRAADHLATVFSLLIQQTLLKTTTKTKSCVTAETDCETDKKPYVAVPQCTPSNPAPTQTIPDNTSHFPFLENQYRNRDEQLRGGE